MITQRRNYMITETAMPILLIGDPNAPIGAGSKKDRYLDDQHTLQP